MPDSDRLAWLRRESARAASTKRLSAWQAATAALLLLALTVAILLAMGRSPICPCGTVEMWVGETASPKTSQQLSDPYTFTHLEHGALFCGLAWAIGRIRGRPLPLGIGFLLATGVECAWEVFENTPLVIERYRTATAALGYTGDSVVNSVSDIAAMMLGYAVASRLPWWATAAALVVTELALGYAVRDNLALNLLMLLHPLESVRAWQSGR